jgi:RsiW-degrading membrane proteinase PrsW (M82 family)
MSGLTEEKKEKELPVRSLHDFLSEINREWDSFRMGSLISMITTVILFVLVVPRTFEITIRRPGPLDTLLLIGLVMVLGYNMYLAYRQHAFYRKWERRIELLIHMEDEILGE